MTNLDSQLELCPFLKTLCLDADDEEIENYCVINFQECEKYIEYKLRERKGE